MISMVVYSQEHKEIKKIKAIVERIAPFITEQKWDLYFFETLKDLQEHMKNVTHNDLLIFDITGPDALMELESLRQTYKETCLLLIASTEISPMSYMKPSIRASSLLLRPIEKECMKNVLKEFLIDFIEKREEHNPDNVFKVETKGEVQYIPCHDIYYFEARKRKIYLRTINEEYPFVDTMDHLEEILSEQFTRCHRSFIVNSRKIVGIALSDYTITLTDELVVPLSRGYRSNIDKIIALRK